VGPTSKADIRKYYELINKAELAIIDSAFQDCSMFYKEAFKLKEANGKDLTNAFIASLILDDTADAIIYVDALAYLGLEKNYLEYCAKKVSKESLLVYATKNYESIYKNGLAFNNKSIHLNRILDSLFNNDQAIRKTKNKAAYSKVDSANLQCTYDLIKQYGFPSRQKIGFSGNGGSPDFPPPYWYFVWHARPNTTVIDSFLYQAVLEGKFRPDLYAELIAQRNDYYHMILENELITSEEKQEIDLRRKEIYLESLEDYRRKLIKGIKRRPFQFYHNFIIGMNLWVMEE